MSDLTPSSNHAVDVGLDNFQAEVLQGSFAAPIVIDFWAPWCGPCQTLKPMLEKLAEEYGGQFRLAKINVDENQDLAAEFGIRSIPAVRVVAEGRLIDQFDGALPEGQLRAFLGRFLPPLEGELEGNADAQANGAENAAATPEAVLDPEDAAPQILPVDTSAFDAALAANPDDHAARLALADTLASAGHYRAALEAALEVVYRDRFFNEGQARKTMVQLFETLSADPSHSALVREFRRALSAALN